MQNQPLTKLAEPRQSPTFSARLLPLALRISTGEVFHAMAA
jgi:hypothetical protein